MTEKQLKSWEKYPPVRFQKDNIVILKERASQLAQERGQQDMTLPNYLLEASQFFENNRAKPGAQP